MKLIDFAMVHRAELLSPVSQRKLENFERRSKIKFPVELREFYLTAGGTECFTELDWRIWPFNELVTLDKKLRLEPDIEHLTDRSVCPDLREYVAFCDVMIEAPLYAFCGNESSERYSEVILLAGDSSPFLAGPIKTFTEFEIILQEHWEDIILPDTVSEQGGALNGF